MDESAVNPLEPLRLTAARHVLGLAHSWEIPPVADRALSDGLYSDTLAELAAVAEPTMTVVAPLLVRTLAELGLPAPSPTEAAWYLAAHCIRRIASEEEPPLVPLSLLQEVHSAARAVMPDKSYVGEGLDLGGLLGIFWSYFEPNENYYEPEKRLITDEAERRAVLDRLAREECRRWLERRRLNGQTVA